ncbi:MAG: cupin domain-containing protein, partial [Pseudonocardiales bacterium]
ISPAGFEHFFDEPQRTGAGLVSGRISPVEQSARYGSEADLDSIARLCQEHGLVFPPPA